MNKLIILLMLIATIANSSANGQVQSDVKFFLKSSNKQDVDTAFIAIKNITIADTTRFSPKTLQTLVASVSSGNHTLAELQDAANRITEHYRKAGYFLARAYLPAQKMEGGEVTIAVLEGKLAEVQLQNTSRLPNDAVKKHLGKLVPGTVLHRSEVDRALLLLGDVPGVGSVDSRLAPGNNTGETVLIAVLKPAPIWSGKLDADNYGSLYSGRARLGGSIEGSSLFGYGERISANLLASDKSMAYGRLALQIPLAADGMTLGAGFTHSQYSLADIYQSLDAIGQSDSLEGNLRYPLVRTQQFNLYGQANIEQRQLRDEVRATATQTDKRAKVASLALQTDWRDGAGGLSANSQASLTLTSGQLTIASADAATIDAIGANTTGAYQKLGFSLGRQQSLLDKLSLSAQLRTQWTNKNLDSSEKFSLGGFNGVRAYPTGEGSGDTGWLGNMELHYAILPIMTGSVFYDAGSVAVNAKPYLTTPNERSLSGAGIGLSGTYRAFDWRMTMAWRDGKPASSEADKTPRFWAQMGWRF